MCVKRQLKVEDSMETKRANVAVIGSGLAALSAAALLAKRSLKTIVVEQHYQPGGSCGAFRRDGRTIDQGTSMFFGFGELGFNPHRFLMNELAEPIALIKHRQLYRLNYAGFPIEFHRDIDAYLKVLGSLFPEDIDGIRAFYEYIGDLYHHVIASDPICVAPSEISPKAGAKRFFRHPIRNIKLLRLLDTSAGEVMRRFVSSERVIGFFNKLTSTYCYTTLDETPAILAITMFMENHTGGSYYPLGSSQQLPGKLEKSLEANGGTICYGYKAVGLQFKNGQPCAVRCETPNGEVLIEADDIVYGGTLQNMHNQLIPVEYRESKLVEQTNSLAMTYPSVVLYCIVDSSVLPEGTLPIEMMADNPLALDEKEVTMYAFSLADPSICHQNEHVVIAIGPSLRPWPNPSDSDYQSDSYKERKAQEQSRLIEVLESHYPGFSKAVIHAEVATPSTIERYTMKEHGCVAGPKQMIGQHLLHRQHAAGQWPSLYYCGEGTVMGTGSPAVTISGISAANMVLRRHHMQEYEFNPKTPNVVRIIDEHALPVRILDKRVLPSLNMIEDPRAIELHDAASACQWCEKAACFEICPSKIDIRGIMRRLECGNVNGAKRLLAQHVDAATGRLVCETCSAPCQGACLRKIFDHQSVEIRSTLIALQSTVFA